METLGINEDRPSEGASETPVSRWTNRRLGTGELTDMWFIGEGGRWTNGGVAMS